MTNQARNSSSILVNIMTSDQFRALPLSYSSIFMTILSIISHTHQDFNDHGVIIKIKPGQVCTTIRNIHSLCQKGVTKYAVEQALKKFISFGYFRQEIINRKTIISISDSELYRSIIRKVPDKVQTTVRQEPRQRKLDVTNCRSMVYGTDISEDQTTSQTQRISTNTDRNSLYIYRESKYKPKVDPAPPAPPTPLSFDQIQSIQKRKEFSHLNVHLVYEKMILHYGGNGKSIANHEMMLIKWCLTEKTDVRSQAPKREAPITEEEIQLNKDFFNNWYATAPKEQTFYTQKDSYSVDYRGDLFHFENKNFINQFSRHMQI